MLQVARLSPKLLGESSELVAGFLGGMLNPDGGFQDRAGQSDLYYSVFAIDGLLALREEVPAEAVAAYLRGFGAGEGLDFIHRACLARCWAGLPRALSVEAPVGEIARGLEAWRCPDGGYEARAGAKRGSAYGCFVALGAYQDAGLLPPDAEAILPCVASLRARDGGYANHPDLPMGLTPPTTAAITIQRVLGERPDPELAPWLLARAYPEGGFFATPMAPIPDLLSTATALHALAGLKADIERIREPTLDFIDTLWHSDGAFLGSWEDEALDCEYTYYGLLALGHLSL